MASPAKRLVLTLGLFLTAVSLAGGQDHSAHPSEPESIPTPAAGTAKGLGLDELEAIALERNPTLVQAGAQVRMSRGNAIQAGLLPNPTVGYVADQIGAIGTAGELHGLFVEQEFITGGKLKLSRLKYAQEARQAEIQVLAQRYRVLYSVRITYYKALVNEKRFQVEQELQANAEEIVKTLDELDNVGQANRADVLQSRMERQRTQAQLQMAQSRLQGSREELAAVVGMPDLEIKSLDGSLDFDAAEVIDRDAALSNLLACSPEIRFAQAEVVRDRIALDREQVEPIPNVNVRAESGYNFESNDTVAGVQIGLRLPIFDKNQGTIFQAQAELSRAQAEVARVELMLRQRFARTFTEYQAARTSAETYRKDLLPQADEVRRLYLESFQQRRAAWPQVLDAQRDYYRVLEEYLDTAHQARRAEAAISTFLLEGGLEQPREPTPQGHRDATPKPR